jgi:hypothetical protein
MCTGLLVQAAEKPESLVPLYPGADELLELDEMHHYVKKAVNPKYGLLLLISNADSWPTKLAVVEIFYQVERTRFQHVFFHF